MLDELIGYMKTVPSVRFDALTDVAHRFKRDNPLDEWAEKNPHRTGATARNAPVRASS
jgi:hypothetical protein